MSPTARLNAPSATCPLAVTATTHQECGLMEDAMIGITNKTVQLVVSVAMLAAMLTAGAAPAAACNPTITMGQVDQALGSVRLTGSKLADANALRDDMAEAVQRNDQRRAHNIETQVMALMGYVEDRPVSRSAGCSRNWTKRG